MLFVLNLVVRAKVSTKLNKTASASLTKSDKISDSAASKTLSELQSNGDILHKETKEVAGKVADR